MNTTCLDCGNVITKGSRCVRHKKIKERIRNALPRRQAYRDPLYKSYVKDSRCALCGTALNLTKDHVISLMDQGSNNHSNLQTLCRSCNSRKKDRSLIQ